MAMQPFIWGNGGEQLTPQQVERRRIAALLQSQRASDTSPVGHWTQAAARGLNGFLAGRTERNADRQENAGLASADAAIQGNPVLSALMGGQQMPAMAPAQGEGGIPVPSAPVQGGGDPTLDLIKGFEGFRETPYWDVNAFRTGYGSDTITTADGRVIPVSEGMQVSRADAERDLQRRVSTEFQPRAQQAAGAAWDTLGAPQRAALTSIAYNYGSVPEPVAQALQSGGDVGAAIMSLAGHNDGINADRRAKEAALFSGMATPSVGGVAGNMPQAPSGVVAALTAAQSNPWVAQKYGPVIDALMQQEMGRQDASYQQTLAQQDPMYQAQLQAAQIANQQAMMPQAQKPIEVGGVLLDPTTFEPIFDSREPDAYTLGPGQIRVGPDGQTIARGPDAQPGVVVNNMPGQDKFDEAFASGDAATLGVISEAGISAQRNIGRINQLESLLQSSPTGMAGIAKQRLGELGINTEGLDDIQAAQALVNTLVPEQRPPGSGPMSDADLELFKQSLPRIVNQPGGNATIIQTMRGIAQYDAAGAEIVQKVRDGSMTRAEGFAALQARPNPMANFKAPPGSVADPAVAGAAPKSFRDMPPADLAKIDLSTLTDAQLDEYLEATAQ